MVVLLDVLNSTQPNMIPRSETDLGRWEDRRKPQVPPVDQTCKGDHPSICDHRPNRDPYCHPDRSLKQGRACKCGRYSIIPFKDSSVQPKTRSTSFQSTPTPYANGQSSHANIVVICAKIQKSFGREILLFKKASHIPKFVKETSC